MWPMMVVELAGLLPKDVANDSSIADSILNPNSTDSSILAKTKVISSRAG